MTIIPSKFSATTITKIATTITESNVVTATYQDYSVVNGVETPIAGQSGPVPFPSGDYSGLVAAVNNYYSSIFAPGGIGLL